MSSVRANRTPGLAGKQFGEDLSFPPRCLGGAVMGYYEPVPLPASLLRARGGQTAGQASTSSCSLLRDILSSDKLQAVDGLLSTFKPRKTITHWKRGHL